MIEFEPTAPHSEPNYCNSLIIITNELVSYREFYFYLILAIEKRTKIYPFMLLITKS